MEIETSLFDKIMDITATDYKFYFRNGEEEDKVLIPSDSVIAMLEDLVYELGIRDEKIEDLVNDMKENYEPKKFDPYAEYGISEDNFH